MSLCSPLGTPIISGSKSITSNLSQYIDHHLQMSVRNLSFFVKDTRNLLWPAVETIVCAHWMLYLCILISLLKIKLNNFFLLLHPDLLVLDIQAKYLQGQRHSVHLYTQQFFLCEYIQPINMRNSHGVLFFPQLCKRVNGDTSTLNQPCYSSYYQILQDYFILIQCATQFFFLQLQALMKGER